MRPKKRLITAATIAVTDDNTPMYADSLSSRAMRTTSRLMNDPRKEAANPNAKLKGSMQIILGSFRSNLQAAVALFGASTLFDADDDVSGLGGYSYTKTIPQADTTAIAK
mmetsp:Transcript_29277/g.85135  ORF Transcript_29277/g.85135 Transcript_29277/m.85135 type:complete len:110 (-) Transcript_29277:889-1218(-)